MNRLSTTSMLADMQALQLRMVEQDVVAMRSACFPTELILTIYRLLGGTNEQVVIPFAVAWYTLIGAVRRLDHVQDGDEPILLPRTGPQLGAAYNSLLCYLLLATSLLDDLDQQALPVARILRLRRFWNDCLLRAASGQQSDIEALHSQPNTPDNLPALDQYQHVAQAKSGALFALAFGGTAVLVTDELTTITALSTTGEIFGTLVQYLDDLRDAPTQGDVRLTLPATYQAACQSFPQPLPMHPIHAFWQKIYTAYLDQVNHSLVVVAPEVRTELRQLFTHTFGPA